MHTNPNLKSYTLTETPYYKVHGRAVEGACPLPLFFNGNGVEVNVTGTELWVEIETDYEGNEPWIYTTIDGAFMSRQMLLPGSYSLCLFRNMSPEPVKNVKLIRELQPIEEDDVSHLVIKGFRSDGSFFPVPEKPYKLEFIGDSITSGEGTYGNGEDADWISMYMGCSRTYAAMVSDALNADFHLFSRGGWGVLCGWDNNPDCNIPSCYEKFCGLLTGEYGKKLGALEPYRFESWQPDAIIINLGTNDATAFNNPSFTSPVTGNTLHQKRNPDGTYETESLMRFEQAVIDFLIMLRKHYPHSHILWAYGMLGYDLTLAITEAINRYSKEFSDSNVAFLQLPNTTAETVGSHAHPGVKSHERAAKVLLEYLKPLLGA